MQTISESKALSSIPGPIPNAMSVINIQNFSMLL